jgi:hypothetical protein
MMLTKEMPVLIPLPLWPDETLRQWQFERDFIYKKWPGGNFFIEAGFIFNGASIPRFFRRLYSPTGILFIGSIFHDKMFQDGYIWLCDENGIKTQKLIVSFERANEILKEVSLIHYPEHSKSVKMAVFAVSMGGRSAWNKCRKRY